MVTINGNTNKGFSIIMHDVNGLPLSGFVYAPIEGWARGITMFKDEMINMMYPYK